MNAKRYDEGSLEKEIKRLFGESLQIVSKRPVYGGDINKSYVLCLSDGTVVFMKSNALKNLTFFEAEVKGLEALYKVGAIGVPKTLSIGTDEELKISFLLMEYIEAAPKINAYWETFGMELATLHKADCRSFSKADHNLPFGFHSDNYIGASPQLNTPKGSWLAFFRECRLLPQMKMAEGYFDSRMHKQCVKLMDHLDAYLTEPEFPSLIHGDLWSGNAICGPDGKAWIFDPATYVGHYEAELAMTELFGGYSDSFYRAYHEVNPIDGGYRDRKDLYNLYHLLNHLNLFGSSYLHSVQKILDRYI